MYQEITNQLIEFINAGKSMFHVIGNVEAELLDNNFEPLYEKQEWNLEYGGKYYVKRNDASIIAFMLPEEPFDGFNIVASHSDSPTFKVKENPELESKGNYTRLSVEGYGGMLMSPWFDRPLSVAGRVMVRQQGKLVTKLVDVDQDLLVIPSLAIHMDREQNKGLVCNPDKNVIPLLGDDSAMGEYRRILAESAGVSEEEILGADIFLYNRQAGTMIGASGEYVGAPRLDDLQCAFSSMKAFLESESDEKVNLCCIFNSEEVGSGTREGAASTFLLDVITRIEEKFGQNHETILRHLAGSFLISADNAHGLHPNSPEVADKTNKPLLNGGVVLKFNSEGKYITDGMTAVLFEQICKAAEVPMQKYFNRSDMRGGSTLGHLAAMNVSIPGVDIGLAQLAMHSPFETAGMMDTYYMVQVLHEFYENGVEQGM